jgi:hypothetical protein
MKCLVLLILVFICTTVDGLSCIDGEESLGMAVFDRPPEDFVTVAYNLPTIKVGDNDVCRVKFVSHAGMKWFGMISYDTDFTNSELGNNEVLYETHFVFDESKDMISNHLEYACSEDNCDKQFIVDHIGWLFTITHSQLAMNINQLIKDDNINPGNNFKIIIEKKRFLFFDALVKMF